MFAPILFQSIKPLYFLIADGNKETQQLTGGSTILCMGTRPLLRPPLMADWATVQTDKRASCNKPSIMVRRLRIEGRNYKVGVELRRGTHDGGERN